MNPGTPHRCSFVPPYLLLRLGYADGVALDERLRAGRGSVMPVAPPPPGTPAWTVHSAEGSTTLPGRVVRTADDPAATGDAAVDEAATGTSASLALFAEVFGRDSYDGRGAPVSVTVHYGTDYANAFWDGTQLVFGDGDGEVFDRFTKPVDVLGHELAHAVTERSAGLVYQGQSGALNESVSDVFASCVKQRILGQEAAEADWLIGEGIFLPGVQGRALRDMAAPGTAYDDPRLGRDPQPGHLDDFVVTTDDNGGVHINSGIPNRAFQRAAVAIGGTSWDGAGQVWYAALTGGAVGPTTDFAGFAAATVAAAEALGPHGDAVRAAWEDVGVVPGSGGAAGGGPAQQAAAAHVVHVRRTGGFAGLVADAEVDLDSDDPRAPEARALAERIDLAGLRSGTPRPDHFVYELEVLGASVRVPEQELTEDARRLVQLVLGSGGPTAT